MEELTDEQVANAFVVFHRTEGYEGIRAAAPFLQVPWNGPTDAELREFAVKVWGYDSKDVEQVSLGPARQVLEWFVQQRNASLLPKPVNLRREAVMNVLRQSVGVVESYSNGPECVADRILDAIDGIK